MDKFKQVIADLDKLKNVPLLQSDGKIQILKGYTTDKYTRKVPNGWFKKPTEELVHYINSIEGMSGTHTIFKPDNQESLYDKIAIMKKCRLRYLVMLKSWSDLGYTIRPLQKITK